MINIELTTTSYEPRKLYKGIGRKLGQPTTQMFVDRKKKRMHRKPQSELKPDKGNPISHKSGNHPDLILKSRNEAAISDFKIDYP